jgi:acyl-CoA oxidase
VRGLELEAKWDPATRQFILNSPTLTSSKWWNGSLGITGNHAIVVAQLMLPTKSDTKSGELSGKTTSYTSYGPHTFVVQVRAFKTHKPMKGVVIGDIGPKYGYITMDNAYVLFDNYRIPHSALLSRHAKVDPDTGAYSKPKVRALIYGSMTFSRSVIVMQARMVLARAVTIAIRYSAIRHQFSDRDGGPNSPEVPVLDYQTVQIRVLPLLATMFALHYSGQAMGDLFYRTRTSINSGDFSELADLHNMSTGLKSLCTGLAADGIETCRRVLGGHGFGGGSGMIQLNNDYLSKPTVEGDNWMITQQVAAYLIKKMTAVAKDPDGNSTDSTEDNLRNFVKARTVPQHLPQCAGPFDVLKSDQALVDAFQWRAAALVSHYHFPLRIVFLFGKLMKIVTLSLDFPSVRSQGCSKRKVE